jgi:hypothetical protein
MICAGRVFSLEGMQNTLLFTSLSGLLPKALEKIVEKEDAYNIAMQKTGNSLS